MSFQQELFDDNNSQPQTRRIVISANPGRVLSKSQKAFNRLLTRIEDLRREIREATSQIELALQEYQRDVHPRLGALATLQKDVARRLASFVGHPSLKRGSDHDLLAEIVSKLIYDAGEHEGGVIDEDLRTILAGMAERRSREQLQQDQMAFEALRSEVEGIFGAAGVGIDLSELGPDATEDDLHARVEEAIRAAHERGASPGESADAGSQGEMPGGESRASRETHAPRRRTRMQIEREQRQREAEEARRRTLGTIYKQLAKVLHPDLEPDPEKRAVKLVLMQQLTAAHSDNDLHTLLRLELEWLHREEGDLDRLTEEKLAIYNAVLREQVADLERERAALATHPRFLPLVVDDGFFGLRIDLHPSARVPDLDAAVDLLRQIWEGLGSTQPLPTVRGILKDARAQRRAGTRGPF